MSSELKLLLEEEVEELAIEGELELFRDIVELTDDDKRISKVLKAHGEYNEILEKLDNIHYEDNIYCSLYLGNYIEKYVMEFLGGERIPVEMEDRRNGVLRRPVDFLLDYEGLKLKIKHIASCLIYGSLGHKNTFYWKFDINYNHYVDAFILSAWDTRKSLIPEYMWLIMKDQEFGNDRSFFWKREDFKVEDSRKRIEFMSQFEMKKVRIGQLSNYVNHAKKNDLIAYLIDKRRQIYLITGIEIDLKSLAYIATVHGFKD